MSEYTCTHCTGTDDNCTCINCECDGCIAASCTCRNEGIDKLVEQASKPNLGALMRAGKKSGLIKAVPTY